MRFAYLDPGTGSMIVQVALGGLAAVAVFFKMFWHRFRELVRIRKPRPAERRDPDTTTP